MRRVILAGLPVLLAGCAGLRQFDEAYRAESARVEAQAARQAISNPPPAYGRKTTPAPGTAAPPLPGAQAAWTGRAEQARSVTGAMGMNCEYTFAGRTFWRAYAGSCPSAIDIQ